MNEGQVFARLKALNDSEIFYRNYRLAKASPAGFDEFLSQIDRERVYRENLLEPEWKDTIPPEYLEDWYFSPDRREGIHVFNAIVTRIFVLLLRRYMASCELPAEKEADSETALALARYLQANAVDATLEKLAEMRKDRMRCNTGRQEKKDVIRQEERRMVAKYPPMGWNSWDCYGAAVTEEQVLQNAEYMEKYLKPYGWEYMVVDIQWASPTAVNHEYQPFSDLCMDEYGRLIPAENRFPSAKGGAGFAPLAAKLHGMGLKFGIHIMRGMPRQAAHRHLPIEGSTFGCHEAANPHSVCAWNPDMYGLKSDTPQAQDYYDSIFRLYAQWGVDYVKCDDIAREYPHCRREIEIISQACRRSGRDMVLSLSPGPAPLEQAEHLKTWANMWRITDDFWDEWRLLKGMFERAEKWCVHAGPGHWPDADMLPLGALRQCEDPESRTAFTPAEQRTMMSLWCMMRSPLMIGGEMTKNDAFTLSLLTQKRVLEIEKETWCAHPLRTTEEESVWVAPRKDGDGCYCALFNLSDKPRRIRVSADELELDRPVRARELWSGKSLETDGLSAEVEPHDTALFRLQPEKNGGGSDC